MTLKLPHLFRPKPFFARSAVRYDCAIDAELVLTDSMVAYEGRIINLSAGGAMFRPRLAYLLARRSVPVSLRIGALAIPAEIVGTSPAGFGVRFDKPVAADTLAALLAAHGIGEAVAALNPADPRRYRAFP